MDIASRPSAPISNPETADAAPPPTAPATIRREDYTPPAWLVPQIALDFTLGLEETRVAARLEVERNPACEGTATLRLNGDGLVPESVSVDGVQVNDPATNLPQLRAKLLAFEAGH